MTVAPHKIPPALQALYKALPKDGKDISILALYRVLFPKDETEDAKLRDVQQKLGPSISRLNRRLREEKKLVRPGVGRGTYRLIRVK